MYIADLHIHSKYSRATSGECVPEYLELWARRKGIGLIGTGDFTHPAWRAELSEKLVPAEEGFYRLKEECRLERGAASSIAGEGEVPRFVLTSEISSIYKKNGRVRKVHNVILLPSLEAAELLSRRLEAIGNIHSDGRPILGLDSRDLLEITLDSCPEAVFIPAHIWTPHFSLFGAFSGFDTIEECFEDLTPYIHAVETGLSSDPPMNWQLSALDRYTLVSNSDAHSPSKLGREANLLNTELCYSALAQSLRKEENQRLGRRPFEGTIEFFPEEGKYHYDGHRNCNVCLSPAQAEQYGGKCPVCGKKLTIGVQHRVEQLADRPEGYRPPDAPHFESLAPLPEVIAAATGQSAAGVKTMAQYELLLKKLGPEFYILREAPLEEIRREAGPLVEEGIRRLRSGQVERSPGYDGEYGTIHLLSRAEREELSGQISLFGGAASTPKREKARAAKRSEAPKEKNGQGTEKAAPPSAAGELNREQLAAVTAREPVLAVIAGPGTGKTKTLVSRIAHLVEQGVKPEEITAVTFTNKAAQEMRERLEQQLGGKRAVRSMNIGTFHSLCLRFLRERLESGEKGTLIDEYQALEIAGGLLEENALSLSPRRFLQEISRLKNGCGTQEGAVTPALADSYSRRLEELGAWDFDDLLLKTLSYLETHGEDESLLTPFSNLLVDEFQDINPVQYRLIRAWNRTGRSLFVIGDPDQSIYGFRGADAGCFDRLGEDFPQLRTIRLTYNYRSAPEILRCALPVIDQNGGEARVLHPQRPSGLPVSLITAQSDLSEGIFVAKEINRMVGGMDMLDAASPLSWRGEPVRSFSDIAILYRTHRQAQMLEKCLIKEGIPYVVTGREDFLEDGRVRGAVAFFRFLLEGEGLFLEGGKGGFSLRAGLASLLDCSPGQAEDFAADWRETASSRKGETGIGGLKERWGATPPFDQWFAWVDRFRPRVGEENPAKLLLDWMELQQLGGCEPMEKLVNTAVLHTDMADLLETLLLGQEGDLARSGDLSGGSPARKKTQGKKTGRSGRSGEYDADAVRLMTFHGSKGLEFPVVFLCGVKKGTVPLEDYGRPADLEEERRLFYVGMTRAKEELLLLTSPDSSAFLTAIPPALLYHLEAAVSKPQPEEKQLSLFDMV